MNTTLANALILDLAAMDDVSVTWTGGGEPTLHPDFDALVAYAGAQGLKQGIYTHGGHINESRAALLKALFTFVYVSLDAADAEAYSRDKGVGPARFAAACDGVRLLAAAEGDATVGVGYLVTEQNWRKARAAAELAQSFGADYVQYRPTILYDQETPNVVSEDVAWLTDAIRELELVQAEFGEFAVCDLDRFRMYQGWKGHGYETCWWSALQTCITPNGKVWTCVNKREHSGAEIGDVSVESFQEIWARRQVAKVTGDCRTLCRGHIPNVALDEIMRTREHAEFV